MTDNDKVCALMKLAKKERTEAKREVRKKKKQARRVNKKAIKKIKPLTYEQQRFSDYQASKASVKRPTPLWRTRYDEYMASDTWRKIRNKLYSLRGGNCEACSSKEALSVHHVSYERFGGSEVVADLKILCWSCHLEAHRNGDMFYRDYVLGSKKNNRSLGVLGNPKVKQTDTNS